MNHKEPFVPNTFYHVYNRANAYEKLFVNHDNYIFFLRTCERYLPDVCRLYAYALLPNHFHFVVKTHQKEELVIKPNKSFDFTVVQVFSNMFNSYTRSFNIYYRRRGTLFSQHFKRRQIDTPDYLKTAVLYVHHNAVHHNLCSQIDDWPYTSHHEVASNTDDNNSLELLSWFGGLHGYLQSCRDYNLKKELPEFE